MLDLQNAVFGKNHTKVHLKFTIDILLAVKYCWNTEFYWSDNKKKENETNISSFRI